MKYITERRSKKF